MKQGRKEEIYLPNITTNLPRRRQKLNPGHPLFRTQARLARKVMQVRDQPLEHVFHARVLAQRVDEDDIVGDVVDGEVLKGGNGDLRGVHLAFFFFLPSNK